MFIFLKFVGAIFVAFILLIIATFFFIKWKFRSTLKGLMEVLKQLGVSTVPPFRIKLSSRSDVFDDDDEPSENQAEMNSLVKEFISLGFEKIDDYYVEELAMSMTALVHRESKTYGVVYDHPVANVWCDVVRKYKDETSWTCATNTDHCMDRAPGSTQHFFPGESLTTVVEKLWDESPTENAIIFSNEEFPRYFEKVYAKEMDWRIERGGVTEAEIRRIAERDETDCTREQIDDIQGQWRTAISEFFSERILKRYRKESKLPRLEWEVLEDHAVIIHERMQAEELYQAFDEDYYPEAIGETDDEDDYERKEREQWNEKLSQIRENLKQGSPQQAFHNLVQTAQKNEIWEFHTSVEKPIPADIWIHKYEDEDEDYDDD